MSDVDPHRQTAGSLAAGKWLRDRLLFDPRKEWRVEVRLDVRKALAPRLWDALVDTRFHVYIYPEEWGYLFARRGLISAIRVADVPIVDMRDDFRLLADTPSLTGVGALIRRLERVHEVEFQRALALIETDLPEAEVKVRPWVASL